MKIALAALAVLLVATAARADSTTVVDVTASQCNGCYGFNPAPLTLNAQFTLEQVTGQFFDSGQQFLFPGTEWEVTSITGTLNGNPMTLAQAPQGIGSWLYDDYSLGSVYFTADGSFSWLEFDGAYDLLEIMDANGDGQGYGTAITWNAVDPPPANTPEPSTYAMLIAGIAGLFALFGLVKKPHQV